jgi:uncharacterized protein (DUF2062 family)
MEEIRITIFAAAIFAIIYGSGMYPIGCKPNAGIKKYLSSLTGIAVLAVSFAVGLFIADYISPIVALTACVLLFFAFMLRRLLNLNSAADDVSAGLAAGLFGLNILIAVPLCMALNAYFLFAGSLRRLSE